MGAKQAIVICPGRGSYTKEELGYLKRHSTQKQEDLLDSFDAYRKSYEQVAIQDLDRAEKFQTNLMTRGENASALIYACSLVDYLNIDPEKIEVVGIIGNSMGWYTALGLSGALPGPQSSPKAPEEQKNAPQRAILGQSSFVSEAMRQVNTTK